MNESYLCALFTASVGMSFHRYLAGLRLAHAKELLRDPCVRVCEAAAAVGFTNYGQFTRAFKAHTGLSPRDWRES